MTYEQFRELQVGDIVRCLPGVKHMGYYDDMVVSEVFYAQGIVNLLSLKKDYPKNRTITSEIIESFEKVV